MQGRQWTALALLAPGNRTTSIGEDPAQDRSDVREFQLNMDGAQVTQNTGVGGQVALQPRRDRRVPVHREPLRRDAGALERHPGERRQQVGHEPVRRHTVGQLPQRRVEREELRHRPAQSAEEPADQRHVRRPDSAGQVPFLRQLRARPHAEVAGLDHRLRHLRQRLARLHRHDQDGRPAARLPAVAADAAVQRADRSRRISISAAAATPIRQRRRSASGRPTT